MNEDGSRIVAADLTFGARVGWLIWIAIGVLIAGLLVLAAGVGDDLLRRARSAGDGDRRAAAPITAPWRLPVSARRRARRGPLALALAREVAPRDPALPRARFLWLAFAVLTIVAFFAILFTGRYPRAIFDFNVGVLRWTWRVGFYSYSALGTDRYPPFSLGPEPDYPARLEIPYPEQLSRGLVLVKWWLLAIPHYLVLVFLVGLGVGIGWVAGWGGLDFILVLIRRRSISPSPGATTGISSSS
jgi:hypothetical protein